MAQSGQIKTHDLCVPREFSAAPEWRRIPYYFLLAVIPTGILMTYFPRLDGLMGWLLIVIWLCCAAGFKMICLLWRLRIEHEGIAYRFLFGWKFYRWDDLNPGQQQNKKPVRFDLSVLNEDDHEAVATLINRHRQQRPMPPPPATLTFHSLFLIGPPSWRLDAKGLSYRGYFGHRDFSWEGVRSVEITKWRHDGELIQRIEVFLNNRPRILWCNAYFKPVANQIVAMILHYVPVDRVKFKAKFGPPLTMQEAQKRLDQTQRNLKRSAIQIRATSLIGSSTLLIGLSACLISFTKTAFPAFYFFAGSFLMFEFWFIGHEEARKARKEILILERWMTMTHPHETKEINP